MVLSDEFKILKKINIVYYNSYIFQYCRIKLLPGIAVLFVSSFIFKFFGSLPNQITISLFVDVFRN